jgi:hypothetical protein
MEDTEEVVEVVLGGMLSVGCMFVVEFEVVN